MRISDWSSDVCSSDLAIDERVFVDRQFDHVIELAAACREQRIERLGLRGGAGIAVEDQTDIGAELIEPLTDDRRDDLVGDQFARVHHGLRLEPDLGARSEEHTSELQSLMRISYAVFCLKKKKYHHYQSPILH